MSPSGPLPGRPALVGFDRGSAPAALRTALRRSAPGLLALALVLAMVLLEPGLATAATAAAANTAAAALADPATGSQAPPSTPLTELPSASAFEAQAKLLPRLRMFYGGSGSIRGLVPILLLMVGPLKIIPAFLKLTAKADAAMRRRMAWHGFLLATATVLVLALFGFRLLVNFNIPLTAILASAGLVLVLVALRLVLDQYDGDDDLAGSHHGPPENPGLELVVQPLVFPIILTPYGLATVITLSALVSQLEGSPLNLLLILLLIMVANLLAMLFAGPILAVLKPRVLQMLGLVLGIIQLALGLGLLFTSFEVQALAIRELLR